MSQNRGRDSMEAVTRLRLRPWSDYGREPRPTSAAGGSGSARRADRFDGTVDNINSAIDSIDGTVDSIDGIVDGIHRKM